MGLNETSTAATTTAETTTASMTFPNLIAKSYEIIMALLLILIMVSKDAKLKRIKFQKARRHKTLSHYHVVKKDHK